MDKKAVSLGELLIDFVSTENGVTLKDAPAFKKAPGGAPANVAVGLAKLGITSFFIGKIGQDAFGDFLRDTLENYGVDTRYLSATDKAKTTLAFVSLTEDGERDFVFYRNPGADMLLDQGDIREECFAGSGVFHFGSITMTHEPAHSATFRAVNMARKYGYLISYDPNLRPALWKSPEEAREKMRRGIEYCDVLKINEEEARFIADTQDLDQAVGFIRKRYDPALVALTRGREGSAIIYRDRRIDMNGYRVKAVDTTGAGDGFVGGLLSSLALFWKNVRGKQEIPDEALQFAARYANAVGALTTLKKGAIPALPTGADVELFMKENPS